MLLPAGAWLVYASGNIASEALRLYSTDLRTEECLCESEYALVNNVPGGM